MKERISLTLNKSVLEKVDRVVDKTKLRNRSHAIEFLVSKALNLKVPSKAFILAGGMGTRLRPITYEIPKALIPLKGKPLIEHMIELLRDAGLRDIIISIGYLGDKIKEHLGNGSKFGVNIDYVNESEPLGTGGPLKLAKPLLNDTFVMMNGDEYKMVDIADMYEFHKQQGALATIGLTTVSEPSKYGVAELKGTRVVGFKEKPKDPQSNLINAGIYILEPEVIDMLPNGKSMIETDLFPKLARKGELSGYHFEGPWYDLGDLQRYEHAIKELT